MTIQEQNRLADLRAQAQKWAALRPAEYQTWDVYFLLSIIDAQAAEIRRLKQNTPV